MKVNQIEYKITIVYYIVYSKVIQTFAFQSLFKYRMHVITRPSPWDCPHDVGSKNRYQGNTQPWPVSRNSQKRKSLEYSCAILI